MVSWPAAQSTHGTHVPGPDVGLNRPAAHAAHVRSLVVDGAVTSSKPEEQIEYARQDTAWPGTALYVPVLHGVHARSLTGVSGVLSW